MSKLALHGMNHKKGGLGGLARHNERMGDNHDNPDIDPAKTKDNFYLKKPQVSLYQDCKNEVESVKANGGRLRSDQNWITEFSVYAPKEPFGSKSEYETYFNVVYSFFAEKVGPENIKSAVVHMDEKTPHMHLDFMPLVRNEKREPVKLSSKEIMTREFLRSIHDELPKRLQEQGFDVQRGDKVKVEDKPLKGRSTRKYKADMEREKAVLDKQLDKMVNEKQQLYTDIEQLEKKKDKLLEDLVTKIEKKQEHIKKEFSYELQETGMFANRKKRAVWVELEVLDKLLSLDKDWHELKERMKLITSQNAELKEEKFRLEADLHVVKCEKKALEEVLRFELPERDISVMVSENQARKDAKLREAIGIELDVTRSKIDFAKEEATKPIVKQSVLKQLEEKKVAVKGKKSITGPNISANKNKKPSNPNGGGDDR